MVDFALSIAVLAVAALILGGLHLIRNGARRRQGVLMLVAALVLLGNVLIWSWPAH